MNEIKSKTMYDQAEEYFHAAQEDFLKPEEDVVPYSVCSNVLNAVKQYLIAFLIDHHQKVDPSMSMDHLLEACWKIDPNFHMIDLTGKLDLVEEVYMDMKTLQSYLNLASSVRALTLKPTTNKSQIH